MNFILIIIHVFVDLEKVENAPLSACARAGTVRLATGQTAQHCIAHRLRERGKDEDLDEREGGGGERELYSWREASPAATAPTPSTSALCRGMLELMSYYRG